MTKVFGPNGYKIKCDTYDIHPSAKMGKNVLIMALDIVIGEGTEIGDNTSIVAYEKLVIGKFCKIRPNANFKARSIEIGDFFFSDDNPRPLIIGGGGSDGINARIKIGSRCVMHDSFINVSESVEIGDDVGLSPSSDILTHGFWGSVLEGYNVKFGPVKIGSGTIIGYRAIIMPNVTIGEHVSVGAGAIVTKDVHDFAVVAGIPAKVIACPPVYPKMPTRKEKDDILCGLMSLYARQLYDKVDIVFIEKDVGKIEISGTHNGKHFKIIYSDCEITIDYEKKSIMLDPICMGYSGEDNEISDDLRDFLRHYGIRIFSRWFKPIQPKIKRKLERM